MKLKICCGTDSININEWADFVLNHPHGNIFQSPEMYKVYLNTKLYEPLVLFASRDNSIVGSLLAVKQKEHTGPLGKLSLRSIIWGGPLIKDNDVCVLEAIMMEYTRAIKNKAIYSQIRNICDSDWAKMNLVKLGYIFEDHLNILIDLEKSEEQLWKDIHPKRKNEIRRATKEGTSFAFFVDIRTLEKIWPILSEVYQRARLPLPHISLFKELLRVGEGNPPLKIFVAMNNEKILGVMLALCWRDMVIDWYAGAYHEYLQKYPNDLLPWEVIRWAKVNGFKIFDFGGAGKPGIPYGVRDFKIKFGGELVNCGRFQKIHQPNKMRIATIGFKIWRLAQGMR